MNFSKMSGYEFEDFIANLLRQKGFKVTQTDYSNDGGVDLIAEYNQPLFSGKYIVQCKKYTDNLIGQPELRDLYGVVMSENANKGILITTSDFTTQAKNFAKGKNLELINGSILNNLIKGVDLTTVEEPELKFWEYPDFDKKTYDFLKKRLKAAKKNNDNYYNLLKFLGNYIVAGNVDMCKSGLINEIKSIIEEKRIITNKDYVYNPSNYKVELNDYIYNPSDKKIVLKYDVLNDLDLYFIEGDLAYLTDVMITNKMFFFPYYPSFLSFYCNALGYNVFLSHQIDDVMEFYKKDPYAKNIKIPSFISLNNKKLKYLFEKMCYEKNIDESLDNWKNNIEKIVDENFENLYSEDELKVIVHQFEGDYRFNRGLDNTNWTQLIHQFDNFKNSLYKAKHLFMSILREDCPFFSNTEPKKFRQMFLKKFYPSYILALKKTYTFTRLGYPDSQLFGYSYNLMLYSAYKQICFEEGCSIMRSLIKTPKSINNFPFVKLPEITQLICPSFYNNYHDYIELEIKSYNEFLNGALDNIFNPVWHDKYYKKSNQEIISEIKEVFKRHNINI